MYPNKEVEKSFVKTEVRSDKLQQCFHGLHIALSTLIDVYINHLEWCKINIFGIFRLAID